ncbi:MAG TPA: hypothetical protein VHM30_10755 [Gemmatimonadaceae bacterium]|nr:hypothetical protein [Gemmatimonadaceae bacterium]
MMYDFVHDVLFLSAVGASKHGDAASALHAALADPARPVPLRGLVFDARLSTSIAQRTSGQIRGIAEAIASNAVALGGRVALIGESDLTFGLLRIGDAYMQCAGLDSRVFRDASDAAEWLAASSGED